jgi:hypothetical protein
VEKFNSLLGEVSLAKALKQKIEEVIKNSPDKVIKQED